MSGARTAIIGISCRFPGADDTDQFWRNLRDGVESVTVASDGQLRAAGLPDHVLADPRYVRAAGVLDRADEFDAEFFGINPGEADVLDPQHRLVLECAWHALEDACWVPEHVPGRVGVFLGGYRNDYAGLVPTEEDQARLFARNVATEHDYLAARIAYKLNLTGPAVTVQTACSTSLVAVHLAVQALRSGECDLALAGGVTVRSGQPPGHHHQRGGILSADGHCRAFDADADGSVLGEGVGLVVLKRLPDAVADGDHVRAVVLGTAIGNDGADRVGFTAPGVDGQANLVGTALARAEIPPDTIDYVEAHGSGTPLGDRIEIEALTRAFRAAGWRSGTRAIGSVKTNIGHTHAASGVAGLIKAVLALEHRAIPPSLHFVTPNPRIDFANSPFRVVTELTDWADRGRPRRAAVSSFGLGGTGAHLVIEEAPERPTGDRGRSHQVLTVSARSIPALEQLTTAVTERLRDHPELDLADVAAVLHRGRRAFRYRRAVVVSGAASAALSAPDQVLAADCGHTDRPVAFMFQGLGDQYVQMGRELYDREPVYRAEVDRCAEILARRCGLDLREALYPGHAPIPASAGDRVDLRRLIRRGARREQGLTDTVIAQPAVFVVEYALARLWMSWGLRPDALIGYSVGEYVAACLAGVFDLEDALVLVTGRARMIAGLPAGEMMAVPLSEAEIRGLLADQPDRLALAAVNGPRLCVIAGEPTAMAALRDRLTAAGLAVLPLNTSHAFHSPTMRPIVAELTALAAGVRRTAPSVPFLSNVTGDWITDADATDPGYWARHLCQPVRFTDGVARLWQSPGRVLLEIGPGRTLGSLALPLCPPELGSSALVLGCLPASHDQTSDGRCLADAMARLWLAGCRVDWRAYHAAERRLAVALPTYPFQRRRHGIEGARPRRSTPRTAQGRTDVADWFSAAAWEPTTPVTRAVLPPPASWLLFADTCGVADALAARLTSAGHRVTLVEPGTGFRELGSARYAIDPGSRADYETVLRRSHGEQGRPTRIVHCWLVNDRDRPLDTDQAQRLGFFSLLALAQAVGRDGTTEPLDVSVVSTDTHPLADTRVSRPEKATVLGPCRVWPLEAPHVTCRCVDIGLPAGQRRELVAETLLAELCRPPSGLREGTVALRGSSRWRQTFIPVRLDGGAETEPLRPGGTYLITGGLGGLALTVAEHLAAAVRCNLVLIGRSAPSPNNRSQLEKLRAAGADVLVLQADITDRGQLQAAWRSAQEKFGAIHGIVHAAGVPGGGLIQLKDPAAAAAVLAPKVSGALALLDVCDGSDLDFVVLFSSLLSVTGGVGQVDYCAANAFLDALAHDTVARGGPPTVSVDWDAWRETGMAARAIAPAVTSTNLEHPLLRECLVDTAEHAIYAAEFSPEESWLVDEHRMLGHPVVPGTGHLELVRAAYAHQTGQTAVEMRDVVFATPIVLTAGQPVQVRVVLTRRPGGFGFDVVSRSGENGSTWCRNSYGKVSRLDARPPERHDLNALISGLTEAGTALRAGPMGFGPRSTCLERVYVGENEYLARLALPDEFRRELDQLAMHPSLMDIAAAYVGLNFGAEFRMPISYGRLRMWAPLPARLFSHQRLREADAPGKQTSSTDITLLDEDGREVVRVDDFVLKRVDDLDGRLVSARDGTAAEIAPYRLPAPVDGAATPGFLQRQLRQGILPSEGVDAFDRILSAHLGPQIVVSTRNLDSVLADATRPHEPVTPVSPGRHPRPDLLTTYVEPRTDAERAVARIWQDLLGVDRVGAHDNFFELGGHSLLGVQLAARLHDALGFDLGLDALFAAPTLAELAASTAT